MNNTRRLIGVALAIIMALLGASSVMASGGAAPLLQGGAPGQLNYQGLLLDPATGDPVADGDYTLTFAIYDDATSTDPGHRLWNETQTVSVQDGLFNVMLGAVTPITTTWLDGRDLWLGITVQEDGEMTPRQPLVSVPYALNANDVRGANIHPFSVVASDSVQVDSAGLSGVVVLSADFDGVYVHDVGDDGVQVHQAGNPSTTSASASYNGFEVGGAQGDGLNVGRADADGVYVHSAGNPSTAMSYTGHHGFQVEGAQGDGLHVGRADWDGVNVGSAGTYGVVVWEAGTDGVNVYSAGDYAGNFNGDVYVNGTINKGALGFKIDHPLNPENKYLYHSGVESPDMMNVYNGNVTLDASGEAWVELPAWFEALNRDYRYQLTPIGAPGPNLYIAQKIRDNHFQIAGGTPGMEVSWQVTGIRQDPYAEAHRIPVEEDKPPEERGTYLHAKAYGQPETMGLAYKKAQVQGYDLPVPER